jgi:ABC-type ATPase involved in cell division
MYSTFQKPTNSNQTQSGLFQSSIVSMKGVGLKFDRLEALKNIDLDFKMGELVFLTGPSGAGKTSLLRLLNREIVPSVGKIEFATSAPVFTAPIFQDLRLIENCTVKDNLWLVYGSISGQNAKSFEKEMDTLLKIFGISEFKESKLKNINGGSKQKVGIIRTILTQPDIILADEPTSSLDMDNTLRLFDLFAQLVFKRKTTIIWATHNRELVNRFNGRVVHLDKGKLIYSGNASFI